MAGRPKTRAKKNRALAVQPTPEDLDRFKAAGIACGYDANTMDRLAARCQGRPLSARGRVRLDDVELLATIDDRLERVLDYLDDHALSKMDGRNLMVAAGILIDKRQILRGEPTAITQFQDFRKLDDYLKQAAEELRRRGDGPDVIDVTPGAAAPVANPGNGSAP